MTTLELILDVFLVLYLFIGREKQSKPVKCNCSDPVAKSEDSMKFSDNAGDGSYNISSDSSS